MCLLSIRLQDKKLISHATTIELAGFNLNTHEWRKLKGVYQSELAACAVEALHKQIIRHLFEMSGDDGGGFLDHSKIQGLAKAMGAKLTKDELKLAMRAMDEEGSGEVDFVEFYGWWSEDKDSGVLTSDAEKNALFTMEIIPLEYTANCPC